MPTATKPAIFTLPDGTQYGLDDLLHLRDRKGDVKVIGVPAGTEASVHTKAAREALRSAQTAIDAAKSVGENHLLSDTERSNRVRDLARAAIGPLEAQSKMIAEQTDRLSLKSATMPASRPYGEMGPWQVQLDTRLVDQLNGLNAVVRQGRIEEIISDPAVHSEVADALMRVGYPLSGLTVEQFARLRTALLKTFKTAEFDALQSEQTQNMLARRAVVVAAGALAELLGTFAPLHESAPATMKLHAAEGMTR